MAVDIVIPSLGESINEVRLGRWHRSEGDWVEKDDLLVEIESDKVTQEFPSPVAGILHITETEGTDLPIGATIGAVDNEAAKPAGDPAPEPSAPAAPDATTADPISMPAAQVENATEAASPIRVTPLARKVAQGRGVDIGSVPGTGLHGKITKSDVLSASPASAAPSEPIITAGDGVLQRGERRVRMSKLRQRIAERLVHAQRTAAMLTTFNEADMSHVIELRKAHKEEFNDRFGVKLGFMSFFIKAAVASLKKYPLVNAFIDGDEIVEHDYVDMSVAVGTDKGLVVPVIRNADRSSFSEIESSILELAGRAREGRLGIDEMTGGTFTISNGGVYGSMLSTPILNPPQSGILGLHRIQNRPIEDPDNAGEIVLRPMMYLALSYDHRIVDGSEAVGFLVHLKQCIEHPERLLLDM